MSFDKYCRIASVSVKAECNGNVNKDDLDMFFEQYDLYLLVGDDVH